MASSNRGKTSGRTQGEMMDTAGLGEAELDLLSFSSLAGGEPRSAQYTGTKALMLAILEDAIRSYLRPAGRQRAEAEVWVCSGRQRSPFCFSVVCETLGLEPEAVRAALKRLREKRVSPRHAIGRSRPNVRRTGRLAGRKALR
jgi:DNA-binding transcriptional ArsR family regulator